MFHTGKSRWFFKPYKFVKKNFQCNIYILMNHDCNELIQNNISKVVYNVLNSKLLANPRNLKKNIISNFCIFL